MQILPEAAGESAKKSKLSSQTKVKLTQYNVSNSSNTILEQYLLNSSKTQMRSSFTEKKIATSGLRKFEEKANSIPHLNIGYETYYKLDSQGTTKNKLPTVRLEKTKSQAKLEVSDENNNYPLTDRQTNKATTTDKLAEGLFTPKRSDQKDKGPLIDYHLKSDYGKVISTKSQKKRLSCQSDEYMGSSRKPKFHLVSAEKMFKIKPRNLITTPSHRTGHFEDSFKGESSEVTSEGVFSAIRAMKSYLIESNPK